MRGYFAYGSNMSHRRLEARVGPVEVLGAARLRRHRLRYHKRGRDGSGKCDAFETGSDEDCLYGVVFGLELSQLERLDRFEGPDYRRKTVTLEMLATGQAHGSLGGSSGGFWGGSSGQSPGGWRDEVETYVALERAIVPGLKPYDWYHAFVVSGAEAYGLPSEYLEALRRVETRPDENHERRRENEAIAGGTGLRAVRPCQAGR